MMKKIFTRFLAALALLVFMMPSLAGWGQTTETLNIATYASANSWANDTRYQTASVGEVTFTATGGSNTGKYYSNDKTWRFYANENATLTISVPSGDISSVTPTFTVKDSGTLLYGNSTLTSGTAVSVSGTSVVFSVSQSSGSKGKVFFTEISVTYTSGGSAYTITAHSNNDTFGTVSLNGNVITGSPKSGYQYAEPAYAVNPENSATVSQNGNAFTVTPSANTTVTINFEAIPTYTVTLGDDNSTLTEETGGAGVTLPSRNAIDDYTFAGWSETDVSTETTTAPTIIAAGEYHPTANITLYPVYSKTIGGGGSQNANASVTIADYATAHSWGSSSSTNQKSITLNSDVTATCNSGTNSGKYYNDGWRIYQTETGMITITTTNGTLSSVTFTFTVSNTGTLNYNSSAITSGTAVNVSGTSAEFTVGNSGSATNGQVRITAISVNYTIQGSGTTYYWSSPEAATVETPAIVIAENPFYFSTTATITCATEGAAIKYSFDGETWSVYSSALTITETKTIYAKGVKGEDESLIATVTATKNLAEPTVTVNGELTLDLDGATNVSAGTLIAAVTYNDNAVAGATVTWSSNNTSVATIDASTGAVTLIATGEVTFTATYAGNSDYAEATGTKNVTVTDSNPPGTESHPYTVAQAIAYINTLGNSTSANEVYVSGIISQVVSYNDDTSITYWISDDGTTTTQMQVYKGKGLNGEGFSAVTDLAVGDIVTVKGYVKKYSGTPEFDKNNVLVSWERPTYPIINANDINLAYNATSGTINYTISNSTGATLTAALTTGDWITSNSIAVANDKVTFACSANEGNADRTATITLSYTGATDKVITVTQAHYVPDFVTLPFNWAGGVKNDLTAIAGVSGYGLGSDYAVGNAPYRVKFDNDEDYILIKTNEQPAVVSFGIKKIGGDGDSSITIQSSSDGTDFTDVETFSNPGEQNAIMTHVTTNAFAATDRYVRIYFNKPSGGSNVGVGPITIKGIESYTLNNITGYSGEKDHYVLIASPVTVNPENVVDMTTGTYDLYYFDQSEVGAEWQNYEVFSFNLVPGKGYLYANQSNVNLTFTGTPYVGNGKIDLNYDDNANFKGWNLIGNPFGTSANLDKAYYRLNLTGDALNVETESSVVAAMEGVFVQATAANETATFTAVNPGAKKISKFNVMVARDRGTVLDNAIIRFDEGNMLEKFSFRAGSTKLYFTEGNKDYAVVCSDGQGEMPVNFKAETRGTYTLSVKPENVEVSYLHLIDNLTGANVDLLANPSYTFEANTNDYASRFRLVFTTNADVEDNTATETFAYYNGSEWVISNPSTGSGSATLQVIDVMGRVLRSEQINGNTAINLNQAAGIYMLRLVNGENVMVQKVVVR